MGNKTDMSKLSRADELSVRKVYIEKMLAEIKKQTESTVMLLLAQSFDKDVEQKAAGQVVFMERWLKDIDKEIEEMQERY